jgi:GTPase KRas protein
MGELKVVLVGVGGVGKSASTITYVSNIWISDYDPTIEDSHRKQVAVDGEVSMLDILDTAGQEEYESMQDQWFRTGEGFLMIYAITNKKSFMEISRLRDKILRIKDKSAVPMVLMGNKSDLENEREVSKKEGEDMAANFNIPFFEASAKNHQNIDEAFDQLVREIRRFRKQTTGVAGPGKTGSGLSGGKKKACSLF